MAQAAKEARESLNHWDSMNAADLIRRVGLAEAFDMISDHLSHDPETEQALYELSQLIREGKVGRGFKR